MFKLNIWSRLLSYIILCACIILAQNKYEILAFALLSLIISIISRKSNSIVFSIVSMLFYLLYFCYPFLEIFMKIFLLISYCSVTKDILSCEDRRYLYELDAYFLKGRKGNRYYIKKNYHNEIKNKNIDLYEDLPGYQSFEKHLKEEAILKTKQELNDIYMFNKLRYFKYYHRKTSLDHTSWNLFDILLILLLICVLIISIVVR